ncbi:aldose 1-epimerase family protein [Lactobacillus sp. ESL0791]|uniref:aldose 1-epimerase family protein n=1 Tax=Lactobacillus sp. ESL0791 TaxID=2983234 RepID=UPI0023F9693F|nr:aldose 1-epimerase family protein [Lactobacillus sp. ESL0791]MDF7639388.1 aldose 1-epimerase family protein [Lactobacillus sp. ESL0791]
MDDKQFVLENDLLKITVHSKGAEVKSIFNKALQVEYLWQGNEYSWKRTFPILFPIVGKLRNNQFSYQKHTYQMMQHGFARDSYFTVVDASPKKITLQLTANQNSRKIYPFAFRLEVSYTLNKNSLQINYCVTNTSTGAKLFYSIGGHPGFNVPFLRETVFTDYYLEFTQAEGGNRQQYFLNSDSLLLPKTRKIANSKTSFRLSHELFKNEAIIMNLVQPQETFTIRHKSLPHSVAVTMFNTPLMDFWSSYPNYGDFVSVEPCWGLADPAAAYGDFSRKPFVNCLEPLKAQTHRYTLTFS